jgi:hypothetical protein
MGGASRTGRRSRTHGVRWPRRIAGVLATVALLGTGTTMAMMVLAAADGDRALVAAVPEPTAVPTPKARSPQPAGTPPLTKAQKAARAEAVALLRAQGYLPTHAADYDPRRALRVLVGYRNGDPLGPRRAFFFQGAAFIGYDTASPSTRLRVVGAGKQWVTLGYGVFAPGAERCCPASTAKVRFEWRDGALQPAGAIPAGRIATG